MEPSRIMDSGQNKGGDSGVGRELLLLPTPKLGPWTRTAHLKENPARQVSTDIEQGDWFWAPYLFLSRAPGRCS